MYALNSQHLDRPPQVSPSLCSILTPNSGSPVLSITGHRIPSITWPISPNSHCILEPLFCFRSNCWLLPRGAALFTAYSMSTTSPSSWQPPRQRLLVPSAAQAPVESTVGIPVGSLTCLASAWLSNCKSQSDVSCASNLNARGVSSPSASQGSPSPRSYNLPASPSSQSDRLCLGRRGWLSPHSSASLCLGWRTPSRA